ncbi:MAG: IclR family transcriptional regulator [Planctomycetota bacterium]
MESGVLGKAFLVLEVLAAGDGPQALGDVTRQVGLNKPTVHRILNDLLALGYVESHGSGSYGLTRKLSHLAAGQDYGPLMQSAEPHLEALHELTEETVNLGVLRGARVAYLRVLESTQPLRRIVESGELDPFHSTALGRCIVSHMPEPSWTRLLRGASLESRTPATITSVKKLREVLHTSRERGYAVEEEENDVGVMCLACPVRDHYGVQAAVSLTVPLARADAKAQDKMLKDLKRCVKSIEKDLKQHADQNDQ